MKQEAGRRHTNTPGKRNFSSWGVFFLLLLLAQATTPGARGDQVLEGRVVSWEDGVPIPDASVFVWRHPILVHESRTDGDGRFSLSLASGSYDLYVHADDPTTPGVDYIPYHAVVGDIEGGGTLVVELKAGASVVFQGNIQFVDTEELPRRIGYEVTDAETGETLTVDGFLLEYGTSV